MTGPKQVTETESVITDEKMILSIAMTETTLYDEIHYTGSPTSFAWVLPIKGAVTVGLSSDILFQTLNQLTAPSVTSPAANCPAGPVCSAGGGGIGCGESSSANASIPTGAVVEGGEGSGYDPSPVTVTSEMQVGPYETVQLHSSDGSALTAWLTAHGYEIPDATKPVVAAYVAGGFDFLALKLVPGEGVQTMRPVRVTSQGAAPSLPLHMVAVGTGAVTGITIWVVAEARWEPANFPTFILRNTDLAWDWASSSSNYESLRLSNEAALGGRGWQIESSIDLNKYNFSQSLLYAIANDTNQVGGYPRGEPASNDAGPDAGELPPRKLALDDLEVLFGGISGANVRVTRMRSDVAKAALPVDMQLQAASDQSQLSNAYVPDKQIGEPQCAIYDGKCNQVGTAPRSQAAASASSGCATAKRSNELGASLAFAVGLGGVALVRRRRRGYLA